MMRLLDMPDEILSEIIGYIVQSKPLHRTHLGESQSMRAANILSLLTTCQRISELAEPNLYADIELSLDILSGEIRSSYSRTWISNKTALQAFERKPLRFKYIQILRVSVSHWSSAHAQLLPWLLGFLARSVNVHSCYLSYNQSLPVDQTLIDTLLCKPITHLIVTDPDLQKLTDPSAFLQVKNVRIYGKPVPIPNSPDGKWWQGNGLSLKRQRKSPVEDMTIRLYPGVASVYEPIVSWAASLRALTIYFSSTKPRDTGELTIIKLQEMVNHHSATLEAVAFGRYNLGSIPDFSHFPSLRELRISNYDLFPENARNAARKLSCPNLKTLRVSFSCEYTCSETIVMFRKFHYTWMKRFCHYRSTDLLAPSELQIIMIMTCECSEFLRPTQNDLKLMGVDFSWDNCRMCGDCEEASYDAR